MVSADGKKLLGAVLIGDVEAYGDLLQLKLNDIELPNNIPEALILPSFDGAKPVGLGVDALPMSAVLCSCNNVTKQDLCSAIEGGVMELGELGAPSPKPPPVIMFAFVGQVLKCELTKLGVEVKKDICEHFAYSRQEMYHLAKLGNIRSFDHLVAKHGKGDGCNICKPTAALIFSSLWNQHILKKPLAGLQDTNNYCLANMQKDGTYSIVPRVPAGEIYPKGAVPLVK